MMGRESDANLRHARELLEQAQGRSTPNGSTSTNPRRKKSAA
jgi:hypothetical protein